MPHIRRIIALAGLALALPSTAAAAPAGAPDETGDISVLYRLARTYSERPACEAVEPGQPTPPANLAAAREHADVAAMFAFAATHFPAEMGAGRDSQINTLVSGAASAYVRAFDCDPAEARAIDLHRAIDLLRQRAAELPAEHPKIAEFTARADELTLRLPRPKECPAPRKCPVASPPPPPTGYAARYRERITLGVGIGGGRTYLRGSGPELLDHMTLRLVLGPRFVLGKRKRQALAPGFQYAFHMISSADSEQVNGPSGFHQAGPLLDYGVMPHRMFSLHAHVGFQIGAGIVRTADHPDLNFHTFNMGGGAALCTLQTALCVRVHGNGSVSSGPHDVDGFDAGLHLDILRIADYVLDRRGAG